MFCLSYCLLLTKSQLLQSRNTCLPPLGASYSPDNAKRAWFGSNVGVVQKFHVRYTRNPIFCPHNL